MIDVFSRRLRLGLAEEEVGGGGGDGGGRTVRVAVGGRWWQETGAVAGAGVLQLIFQCFFTAEDAESAEEMRYIYRDSEGREFSGWAVAKLIEQRIGSPSDTSPYPFVI